MSDGRIVLQAPAKVNLYLEVGRRLADGYHPVKTVMHTVGLCDTLAVEVCEGLSSDVEPFALTCVPSMDIPPEKNLVTRAAESLAARFARPIAEPGQQVRVVLEKRIPEQAGLGGGSSDAAALLRALCRIWGEDPEDPKVLETARLLGSDVPFFLHGGCAGMDGRGDTLKRRYEPLDTPVVLVKGREGVPTSAAYRAFDEDPHSSTGWDRLQDVLEGAGEDRAIQVAHLLSNDLEPAARCVVPSIGDYLDALPGCPGVLGSLLSGSGSAAFALCADEDSAQRTADRMTALGFWAHATHLTGGGDGSGTVLGRF